jgi:ATPase family associated with various cellular activities (AAA)
MTDLPEPGSFGATFEDFMRAMTAAAQRPEPEVARRVRAHLGADPKNLPATTAEFPVTERANLQLAMDAVLPDAELIGFSLRHMGSMHLAIADVVAGSNPYAAVAFGTTRHVEVDVGDGRVVRCIESGLFLTEQDGEPVALMLSPASSSNPMQASKLQLEGIAAREEIVSGLLRDLRAAMNEQNVFRGKVFSLQADDFHSVSVHFHSLPDVARGGVILPDGTLERLEQHAVGIAQNAQALRAAGRHLKRGILLHGPPGTGKTLSLMYLLGAMRGRTTILLTGRGLALIGQAVRMARELSPATVVFEDIDLVAAERTMPMSSGGVLFELLNQMEGIAEDEDLLFLLTTNRPDLIEPALAARPGRIDLALEIPLPDEDGRRRLLRLYGEGIELDDETGGALAARSAGVSGAFIKELVRQAWLRSTLEGRDAPAAGDLVRVLDELLDERSALTRRLLGQQSDDGSPDSGALPPMVRALKAAGMPVPEAD